MRWFDNFSITVKLAVLGVIVTIALTAVSFESYKGLTHWSDDSVEVRDVHIPALVAVNALNTERMSIRAQTIDVLTQVDPETRVLGLREIQRQRAESWSVVDQSWSVMKDIDRDETASVGFAELEEAYRDWREIYVELDRQIDELVAAGEKNAPAGEDNAPDEDENTSSSMPMLYAEGSAPREDEFQRLMKDYEATIDRMIPISERMGELLVAEVDRTIDQADRQANRAVEMAGTEVRSIVTVSVIGVVLVLVLSLAIYLSMSRPLVRLLEHFGAIGSGDYDQDIDTGRRDEVGKALKALADMQAKLKADITETRRVGNENQRIRNALDSVTANVMVADANHDIIYINEAVHQMFRRGAKDIRRDLPNFDPERLLGSNIDLFHKDPAHQRQMLEALRGNHSSEIMVGGRTYALVASAIFNDEGERLGTAVQWTDRTDEVAVEKEINTLVSGAVNGDLGQRIDLEGKEGFFHKLGKGINQLMDVTQTGLNEVSRVLGEVARGNLNERVTGDYRGTFGQLQQDTNDTVDKLKSLIGQIKESVDTINTAAKEISSGNTDLSQRTEEQASSLEQTASSMEELTSTVKQNAENARQANQLASSASEVAAEGGSKVRQAVSKMHELTESSEKISGIISVIDGIAFQTNILALNAAVEAARAGEQGRGFAVVAGEVRNLAQRSAAAAKEIQALITADGEIVAHGSKLVEEAGGIMGDIVNEVRRVTDLMAEISAASDEQSQGIEQVNQAVTQMDEVTQQNAALVEEAAAAAESLEEQSEGLARAVSFFKVDDSVVTHEAPRLGGARRPAVAPAPASARKAKTARPARGGDKGIAQKRNGEEDEWEEF
ncbi:MAG: methyl-accepting chemotaxis protein [Halothiobacillaceae bacterium]